MKIRFLPTAATVMLAVCAAGFAQSVPTRARVIQLQLTLTSASPKIDGATFPYVIQEILTLGSQYVSAGDSFARQIQEVSVGDPVPGLLSTPAIGGWINLTLTKSPNEFAVKMISLLTKGGQPFGTRVSHLRFVGNADTGAAVGTCTVETFDLNGTLLMSASGTLAGALVSVDPDDDYPDNQY
jgi:hypothetical protein